jgi:chemotaxis protein methyltransferase CheR
MGDQPQGSADPVVARLIGDLYAACGLDYRGWSPAVVSARLRGLCEAEGIDDFEALRGRALDEAGFRDRLTVALAPAIDGPFPDVELVRTLRAEVCPRLKTYPSIRVWHAGCATGEEVYTTAIVLREEGLTERSRIYATELGDALVERARSGRSPAAAEPAAARYRDSGGTATLDEYYRPEGGELVVRPALADRITFHVHNLVGDASFNEFQLVVCRGVLPLFTPSARQRALRVIGDSLCQFGYLALGPGEARLVDRHGPDVTFEPVAGARDLLRRVR